MRHWRIGAVVLARDPTTHNLWPFEVVIAGGIGLAGALLGVGAARIAQRLGRARA